MKLYDKEFSNILKGCRKKRRSFHVLKLFEIFPTEVYVGTRSILEESSVAAYKHGSTFSSLCSYFFHFIFEVVLPAKT